MKLLFEDTGPGIRKERTKEGAGVLWQEAVGGIHQCDRSRAQGLELITLLLELQPRFHGFLTSPDEAWRRKVFGRYEQKVGVFQCPFGVRFERGVEKRNACHQRRQPGHATEKSQHHLVHFANAKINHANPAIFFALGVRGENNLLEKGARRFLLQPKVRVREGQKASGRFENVLRCRQDDMNLPIRRQGQSGSRAFLERTSIGFSLQKKPEIV